MAGCRLAGGSRKKKGATDRPSRSDAHGAFLTSPSIFPSFSCLVRSNLVSKCLMSHQSRFFPSNPHRASRKATDLTDQLDRLSAVVLYSPLGRHISSGGWRGWLCTCAPDRSIASRLPTVAVVVTFFRHHASFPNFVFTISP
jgi:hypothetical protein